MPRSSLPSLCDIAHPGRQPYAHIHVWLLFGYQGRKFAHFLAANVSVYCISVKYADKRITSKLVELCKARCNRSVNATIYRRISFYKCEPLCRMSATAVSTFHSLLDANMIMCHFCY